MDTVANLELSAAFMNATDTQATVGLILTSGNLNNVELERLLKAKNHLDDFVTEMGLLIDGTPL